MWFPLHSVRHETPICATRAMQCAGRRLDPELTRWSASMRGDSRARATASISDTRKKVRDRRRELDAQRACVDHHAHEALGSSGSSACASCASNSQPRLRPGSSAVACSLASPRFALAIRVDDARRRWSRERSRDVELRPTEYLTAMRAFASCGPHRARARHTLELRVAFG